jgi:hypothetical protein
MSDPNDTAPKSKVQGEGDYEAAERYREKVTDFVKRSDVDDLARKAAEPLSEREARDNALAEESGRARSKGDDPADIGIMYPRSGSDAKADTKQEKTNQS